VINLSQYSNRTESIYSETIKKLLELTERYSRKIEFKTFIINFINAVQNQINSTVANNLGPRDPDLRCGFSNFIRLELCFKCFKVCRSFRLWQKALNLMELVNGLLRLSEPKLQ